MKQKYSPNTFMVARVFGGFVLILIIIIVELIKKYLGLDDFPLIFTIIISLGLFSIFLYYLRKKTK